MTEVIRIPEDRAEQFKMGLISFNMESHVREAIVEPVPGLWGWLRRKWSKDRPKTMKIQMLNPKVRKIVDNSKSGIDLHVEHEGWHEVQD